MTLKERRRRVQLRYRNILRAAERRLSIAVYKNTIAATARRIVADEYGGGAPKHGWRPPGVVVMDDDALPTSAVDFKHYRTINFRRGLVATDDGDRVDIDAAGGFGPFCFDYLLDDDFAAVVAAGTYSEGDTFTTFTGHTFIVYSTVGGVMTDITSNFSGWATVSICPGIYNQVVAWPTSSGTDVDGVTLLGPPGGIGAGGDEPPVTIGLSQGVGIDIPNVPAEMHLENLRVVSHVAANVMEMGSGETNLAGLVTQCQLEGGPINIDTTDTFRFGHCILTCGLTATDVHPDGLYFDHCFMNQSGTSWDFTGGAGSNKKTDIHFNHCDFESITGTLNMTTVQNGSVEHCKFGGAEDALLINSHNTTDTRDIRVSSNDFLSAPTTEKAIIRMSNTASAAGQIHNINIEDNSFQHPSGAVAATTAYIKLEGHSDANDEIHSGGIVSNSFGIDPLGANTIEDNGGFSVIADEVTHWVFGPNWPVGKVKYDITNGESNLIIPGSADNDPTDSGAVPIVAQESYIPLGSIENGIGGVTLDVTSKTGDYTAASTDSLILCDASGGAFTVTLPTAVGITGRVYHVKKTDPSANAVTLDGDGSETVDGATTAVITTQYEAVSVVSDGSDWMIV